MKPVDFMRELTYPVRNMAIILAMIFFWLIYALAKMSASVGGVLVA